MKAIGKVPAPLASNDGPFVYGGSKIHGVFVREGWTFGLHSDLSRRRSRRWRSLQMVKYDNCVFPLSQLDRLLEPSPWLIEAQTFCHHVSFHLHSPRASKNSSSSSSSSSSCLLTTGAMHSISSSSTQRGGAVHSPTCLRTRRAVHRCHPRFSIPGALSLTGDGVLDLLLR